MLTQKIKTKIILYQVFTPRNSVSSNHCHTLPESSNLKIEVLQAEFKNSNPIHQQGLATFDFDKNISYHTLTESPEILKRVLQSDLEIPTRFTSND